MITNLKYVASDGIILAGEVNGRDVALRFDQVFPYWDYSTEDDFEGGSAKIYGDKVLLTMLTASSQGGVIVLWDAAADRIEHVSDGSYTLTFDMDGEIIYSLKDVFNFKTKANLQLWKIPVGCLNAFQEGERLNTDSLPSADFTLGSYGDYSLNVNGSHAQIKLGENSYEVEL